MVGFKERIIRLERRRELNRKYRAANPEKIKEQNKERNKRWRARNPEHVKALNRTKAMRYYYRHIEKIREQLRKRANKRYVKHPANERSAKRRKQNYGLSQEQYEALLVAQNYSCAGCGTTNPPSYGWVVDHCHETKAVRGLLCTHCNTGLGLAKDNIEILQNWINYLRK